MKNTDEHLLKSGFGDRALETSVRTKNKVLQVVLKAREKFDKSKVEVIKDERTANDNKPTIYLSNSWVADDIISSLSAIDIPVYSVMEDKDISKSNYLTKLFGEISVDGKTKEERNHSISKMEKILLADGSLLMFPERMLNLSSDKLVSYFDLSNFKTINKAQIISKDLFYDVAVNMNVPIVIVTTVPTKDGKRLASIGKEISLENIDSKTYDDIFNLIMDSITKAQTYLLEGYETSVFVKQELNRIKNRIESCINDVKTTTEQSGEYYLGIINYYLGGIIDIFESILKIDEITNEEKRIISNILFYLNMAKDAKRAVITSNIKNQMTDSEYELLSIADRYDNLSEYSENDAMKLTRSNNKNKRC